MVGSPWELEPFGGSSPEKMFFLPFDVEFILQVAFGGDQYRIVILRELPRFQTLIVASAAQLHGVLCMWNAHRASPSFLFNDGFEIDERAGAVVSLA